MTIPLLARREHRQQLDGIGRSAFGVLLDVCGGKAPPLPPGPRDEVVLLPSGTAPRPGGRGNRPRHAEDESAPMRNHSTAVPR